MYISSLSSQTVYHCLLLQAIRRTIDKKTVDVYHLFNEELQAVKKELSQKGPKPLTPSHPKFSGVAHWARMLKKRIERGMMVGRGFSLVGRSGSQRSRSNFTSRRQEFALSVDLSVFCVLLFSGYICFGNILFGNFCVHNDAIFPC